MSVEASSGGPKQEGGRCFDVGDMNKFKEHADRSIFEVADFKMLQRECAPAQSACRPSDPK